MGSAEAEAVTVVVTGVAEHAVIVLNSVLVEDAVVLPEVLTS